MSAVRTGQLALLIAIAVSMAVATTGPATASTEGGSGVPSVVTGHRPGPDALHLPPPRAPQLENTGPWQADPLLISGAHAYRDGEWLYQDFLFDDHGATGVPDPEDPYGVSTNLYSPSAGTFTYPTAEAYRHNAADLVELRITRLADATALRVTLNTLVDPALTAVTIAIGDTGSHDWPHGAGASSSAEVFLTTHGGTAELLDAATGEAISPSPTVTVDLERRQLDLRIPDAAWNPGAVEVPVTVGVGLWDVEAGTYLAPQPGPATEDTPGGGSVLGSALVNVGPRLDEPTPFIAGVTMADTAVGARALAPWWRERQQSLQLTARDLSPFSTSVDFGNLGAAGVTDESTLPTSGPMNRIHASRYVAGQGIEPDNVCFAISSTPSTPGTSCHGRYVGQLQPYAIHVPEGDPPADGWGLTLLLHSLSANHNQYLSTNNQVQLGERGEGHIVITPEGRGPDGFYTGVPEAETFEVWADAVRHHTIDADRVAVSGYSMGGFGTYRLMARYPDLFALGFSVVGAPGTVADQLASLHNTPLLAWNAAADELVNIGDAEEAHAGLVEAGIAHVYDLFTTADHLTLAGNDEYTPGAEWMGDAEVDRDPATIRYVLDPSEDALDVVADHAYWLSGLRLANPDAAPTGTIEVHSAAHGTGRRTAADTSPGGGALVGGNAGPISYIERGVEQAEGEATPPADRLEITATNIASVTIDPTRAGVTCAVELVVDSDGPLDVVLAGCPGSGIQRLGAEDPVALSILAARASVDGASATSATLATTVDFADATTGSALAAAGPLLLTGPDGLDDRVAAALRELMVDGADVRLLGGTAALSEAVANDVRALGFVPRRIAGPTRIETAVEVAATVTQLLGTPDRYLLARAYGTPENPTSAWADAIGASSAAALHGWPILLTDRAGLHPATAGWLDAHVGGRPISVLGGDAALSPAVAAALPEGSTVSRIGGTTRDETAALISSELLGVSQASAGRQLHVHNGWADDGWAWGLAGSSLAATDARPLLPLNRDGLAIGSARLLGCGTRPATAIVLGDTTELSDTVVQRHLTCPGGG